MSGINGWNRARNRVRRPSPTERDDAALSRKIRRLAVEMKVDGEAVLRMSRGELRRLHRLESEAETARAVLKNGGSALNKLAEGVRRMSACAEQAAADGGQKLPASRHAARVERLAEWVCGEGGIALTEERLRWAVTSFDDVQPMTMAELWEIPEAMRIALCRSFFRAAQEVLERAEEQKAAQDWADGAAAALSTRGPAFFEAAFQRLAEREDVRRKRTLEDFLKERRVEPRSAVEDARAEEAALCLRLDNILSAKALLDGMNWQRNFEALSAVERELMYDPAGIYPKMDDESKRAVREQASRIALALEVTELTAARCAVRMAQSARDADLPEVRQTVCYWLYEDEGRAELADFMGGGHLPKRVPDPTGRRSAALMIGLFAAFYAAYWSVVQNIWFAGMGIPLAWTAAMQCVGRIFPHFVRPARLLKMKIDAVPDDRRTLVTMPALLSSPSRAEEICDQMEALGCTEKDENISFLILGDYSDAPHERMPDDEEILHTVRRRVAQMNARAGREKYFCLHRERTLLKKDARWMGKDRKRGALMDLNRVLLGEEGAEKAFGAENRACDALRSRFRYVLTLDADTRYLPETVQKLVGTMAHPLNAVRRENGNRRGYAVLQPEMQLSARACTNAFVRLFAGNGGISSYPASVSAYWQDVTGTGLYGGKGLYDVRAFHEALDGALPEGRILSHDLIEGTLAGTAQVSDICFSEGCPSTLNGVLKRMNRWIRGDWQLLPLIFSPRKYQGIQRRLNTAERLRMADNLLRSLWAPCLLGLFLQSVWMGHGDALMLALLLNYWTPILYLFRGGPSQWLRATARLSVLPAEAASAADAAVRTIWRLAISGKHLMDWVTAADSEKQGKTQKLPGQLAAILLVPGLMVPGGVTSAAALMVLFLCGPGWISDMEEERPKKSLSKEDVRWLRGLAEDTWRFFAEKVDGEHHFLPPDNVQIDPDNGDAARTSPTNIGLYLLSCLTARELGFIDEISAAERVEKTLQTVEALEKWKGHLYNWYDTRTLTPLYPRYVSSVDSGNLAAALLLAASALEDCPNLSRKLRQLAENMDFYALYDADRDLFRIGMDRERQQLSLAHYDLLASESRILSYTALMLGQVPLRHWRKLSRAAAPTGKGVSLASWSGTLFEYLMPELWMRAPENTLLGTCVRTAIQAQRARGLQRHRPWGISESGYYAFDGQLNYQYRAFGLSALALGGQSAEYVTAPYASMLALFDDPSAAVSNGRKMEQLGWRGRWGLYEAADYLHAESDGRPRVVHSYMAHHQAMSLCAMGNALTNDYLPRMFWKMPEARALSLLLEERPLPPKRRKKRKKPAPDLSAAEQALHRDRRTALPSRRLVDAHLLGGAGASAFLTADGAVHYQKNGIQGTRFNGDLLNRTDGACIHLRNDSTGEEMVLGGEMVWKIGGASLVRQLGTVECRLTVSVSPEDGTLFRRLELENLGASPAVIRAADCMPISLSPAEDMLAHPIFRHLFVESRRLGDDALILRRRPREPEEVPLAALHLVHSPGEKTCETDFEQLVGRMGSVQRRGGIRWRTDHRLGSVLNPCSAWQTKVELVAGSRQTLHFAFCILSEEDAEGWIERSRSADAPRRAEQLSAMQAKTMLGFVELEPQKALLLGRMSALLMENHRASESGRGEARPARRESLWALGISGDLPLIQLHICQKEQMESVRDALRACEYYRLLGVSVDLVLVNEHGNDYHQPVRDAISDAIAYSPLNGRRGARGGVHVLEGRSLTEEQRTALHRKAALDADGGKNFYEEICRALAVLDAPKHRVTRLHAGENRLSPLKLTDGNGFGGFLADGRYAIDVLPERTTPAPWANLMANESFGTLLTERGGGFLWYKNSRSGRLTAFANDALSEGWGWMLYLVDEETKAFFPMLPAQCPQVPYRVVYSPAETVYRFEAESLSGELALCIHSERSELRIHSTVKSADGGKYRLVGFVDWLMGTDARDAAFVRTWNGDGACFAVGAMEGVGYFACSNPRVRAGGDRLHLLGRGTIQMPEGIGEEGTGGGWTLNVPVDLRPDVPYRSDWVIGVAEDAESARTRVREFYAQHAYEPIRSRALGEWKYRMDKLWVNTPEIRVNQMANGWLIHQALTGRIRAKTGLYQPGGAFGFRDQLQDMLALLPFEPQRVRRHLLRSAAHQFEDGDVMHWWHEPYLGVRTKISDDLLFLPYAAAQYVRYTGDAEVLNEKIPYLRNVEIEPDREDRFGEMTPSLQEGTLHEHCMRAFARSMSLGEHGLLKMGSGDWNDGMNRVGAQGRGESIWLTEFRIACSEQYAEISPDASDAARLIAQADQLRAAVEAHGWDGRWYLRAYMDDGTPLGGASGEVCRIDAISQAWAVLAGLDGARCESALDAAWEWLADEKTGIVRLLTPPFDGKNIDPGYIGSYPLGVRENGAQYTHAACWLLLAFIRRGDALRAHEMLKMLLPASHSDSLEKAKNYRVEPYVMAADVYDGMYGGRGGWTWYTGSAAWMHRCILELLGFERRDNRVRVCALLGPWAEASVTVSFGASEYRLICRRDAEASILDGAFLDGGWVEMIDDSRRHEAVFPPRAEVCAPMKTREMETLPI